jgi:dihydrofolate reductase
MRRVIYGVACSLDGFIAGPNGEIDWLRWTEDAEQVMKDFWPRVDTMIMGRKTYEVGLKLGGGNVTMPGIDAAYVFSRTLESIPTAKGTHLVKTDAIQFVHELKQRDGKDICLWGGGDFARALFAADLIDEVGLNIHPVILGSGIPTFLDPGRRVPLRLSENRSLMGGCIMATYLRDPDAGQAS